MDHVEAERTYAGLRARRDAGQISQEQFIAGVNALRYQDFNGAWWAINPVDGRWLRWSGTTWEPIPQPSAQPVAPSPAPQATSPPPVPQAPQPASTTPAQAVPPQAPPIAALAYQPAAGMATQAVVKPKRNWLAISGLGSALLSLLTFPYILAILAIGIGAYSLYTTRKTSGRIEYIAVVAIVIGVASILWNFYYIDIIAPDNLIA
jgi:hypothetical protein